MTEVITENTIEMLGRISPTPRPKFIYMFDKLFYVPACLHYNQGEGLCAINKEYKPGFFHAIPDDQKIADSELSADPDKAVSVLIESCRQRPSYKRIMMQFDSPLKPIVITESAYRFKKERLPVISSLFSSLWPNGCGSTQMRFTCLGLKQDISGLNQEDVDDAHLFAHKVYVWQNYTLLRYGPEYAKTASPPSLADIGLPILEKLWADVGGDSFPLLTKPPTVAVLKKQFTAAIKANAK